LCPGRWGYPHPDITGIHPTRIKEIPIGWEKIGITYQTLEERVGNIVDNLKMSLDRAIQLLNTPAVYEDYISIKIKPVDGGCCCYDHWRETWKQFNEFISPYGPLHNEGAVLIESNDEKFVVECHESGPEIIAYLKFGTAVVGLLIVLLKFRQAESHSHSLKFKITKRHWVEDKIEEENSIEIDLVWSNEEIKKRIGNCIKNKKKRKQKK